jgi:predicted PurR-regulated permease PerM
VLTVGLLWVFYLLRTALLPFLLGLLLAYLLMPAVKWIERILPGKQPRWAGAKRIVAILLVFICILGVLGFAIFIGITVIVHNSADMIKNATQIINNFIANGQQWTESIRDKFPPEIRQDVDKVIQNIGNSIGAAITNSFGGGGSFVNRLTGSIGAIFGFAATPVFVFFLLKDDEKIQAAIYNELPPAVAKHARNIVHLIESVLGRYIRAELLLGAIVGSMTLIGLLVMRVPMAWPLAFVNGVCETIPTLGPIIGGAVMGLVTLALAPDKVIWVILLAVVVQLLENNLLVPRIQSGYLHLHPALIIMLLVLGGYLWGFLGLVLTVPVTATLVDILRYVRSVNKQPGQEPPLSALPSD